MFRNSKSFLKSNFNALNLSKFLNVANCDSGDESNSSTSSTNLVEQAIAEESKKIKTPMQFDSLKYVVQQSSIDAYDGFRLIVQKQVNMNAVAVHTYWLGSQATGGQPVYRYRLVLPFDDKGEKSCSIQTDMDFNVDGEVKFPLANHLQSKVTFAVGDQQNSVGVELEYEDECSSSHIHANKSEEPSLQIGYMQSVTPNIMLGGSGNYSFRQGSLERAVGGMYTLGEHVLAAQWDHQFRLLYLRKVNPSRVHLTTDLLIDGNGASQMTLAAEYMLKQSKLHMSVDSNLLLKSTVDTNVAPGMVLQFCAEMAHLKNSYKYGFGILMQ